MDKKSILINQIHQLIGVEGVTHICVSTEEPDLMLVEIQIDPSVVKEYLSTEEVALRNYNSTLRRGQINDETTVYDFVCKIHEEAEEIYESWLDTGKQAIDPKELADTSLVCDAMALHYGINLQAEKEAKMLYNEQRTD